MAEKKNVDQLCCYNSWNVCSVSSQISVPYAKTLSISLYCSRLPSYSFNSLESFMFPEMSLNCEWVGLLNDWELECVCAFWISTALQHSLGLSLTVMLTKDFDFMIVSVLRSRTTVCKTCITLHPLYSSCITSHCISKSVGSDVLSFLNYFYLPWHRSHTANMYTLTFTAQQVRYSAYRPTCLYLPLYLPLQKESGSESF